MYSTRIAELAAEIQESTVKVDRYLQSNGLPTPSFGEDGPVDFQIGSGEIQQAREKAIDSSLELHQLLLGPALLLRPVLNGTSLQAIYKYDIATKVPIQGDISFTELSHKCGLDEPNLRRILRFAIVYHRVFQEPRKGIIVHSAASRKLAEDPLARAALGYMFDEVWQSFAQTVKAMERSKRGESNKTGWSLSQNTDQPVFEYYASHPEMADRFGKAMSLSAEGSRLTPSLLPGAYPWSSVGNGTGTIVDVGGSRGTFSVALARSFPGFRFVVQDLSNAIQRAKDQLPAEVSPRIEFMVHDFFSDQPIKADVYLFCNIFHDWPDSSAIEILRATIPALRPGARIIVNDHLLAEPNSLSPSKEREMRSMDTIMLSLFGSKEREEDDWRRLFHQADQRFKNIKFWVQEGASHAVMEAAWSG